MQHKKQKKSLIERAGSHETHIVDAYIRDKIGEKAVSLVARRLSDFRDDMAIEAERLGSIAGIYRGIEPKIICNQARPQSRFLIGSVEPEKIPVAIFSTAGDYDLEISDELRLAMENNDTSMLSFGSHIGVRLDEPIAFDDLVDNSTNEDDVLLPTPQSPAMLHVVQ